MTIESIHKILTDHGFVAGTKKPEYVWNKKLEWYAHIGSVPGLPIDEPFAVYIYKRGSGVDGKNYYNEETLVNALNSLNDRQ